MILVEKLSYLFTSSKLRLFTIFIFITTSIITEPELLLINTYYFY